MIPVEGRHVHWKQQVEVSSTDEWTAMMLLLLASPPTTRQYRMKIIRITMHIIKKTQGSNTYST